MTPARLSSQALGQGNPVDDLAYVELVNRSDQAVALHGRRIVTKAGAHRRHPNDL